MNFKEWYANRVQYAKVEDETEIIPTVKIEGDTTVELVVAELERLGFVRGNDFSKYGEVTNIDIWYADFYNLFITYVPREGDLFVTLEELKETENVQSVQVD